MLFICIPHRGIKMNVFLPNNFYLKMDDFERIATLVEKWTRN